MDQIAALIAKVKTFVKNLPALIAKYRKFAVALAGVVVLGVGAAFGETSTEYTLVVTFLAAIGVRQAPNVDPAAPGDDGAATPEVPAEPVPPAV